MKLEVAEIFRRFGPSYLEKFDRSMLPNHRKTIEDIIHCRTSILGGHIYFCYSCGEYHYNYHSCGNRHCPKCQHDKCEDWLTEQKRLLLPVNYFLVTFTIPESLRRIARCNQNLFYNILFSASSQSMLKLAEDKRFIGGTPGMIGILHTWTRNLHYHPHLHFLIPGGGLSPNGKEWKKAREDFLFPVKALSEIFKAKFRDLLKEKKPQLFKTLAANTFKQNWVVNCIAVGTGQSALKYLAPYIFRVAISNNRIKRITDDHITFTYKQSKSKLKKNTTIHAHEFIRRFLQHVLPKGFVKIRYYGIFAFKNKHLLQRVRDLFQIKLDQSIKKNISKTVVCPVCGMNMIFICEIHKGEQWPNAPPKMALMQNIT